MVEEIIEGYVIERKKVKNINLRIREDLSIYISAPINLDKYYIESFIKSKKQWIESHVERIKTIKKHMVEPTYSTGDVLRYLGYQINVEVIESEFDKVKLLDSTLKIYTKNNDFAYKKKLVLDWYFIESKRIYKIYLEKWLEIMDEKIEKLNIKPIKGKWGTCNYNKKIISLSTELVKRSVFEIEYVVIHEIAHLKFPNHGEGFYKHVEKYMSNYKEAENMLKKFYRN